MSFLGSYRGRTFFVKIQHSFLLLSVIGRYCQAFIHSLLSFQSKFAMNLFILRFSLFAKRETVISHQIQNKSKCRNYYEHNSLKAALFVIENQKDKMKKRVWGYVLSMFQNNGCNRNLTHL